MLAAVRVRHPALQRGRKYPVFFEHYGGPHSQPVARSWMNPRAQYIVDHGYIYFEIDNRGSANRGVAFLTADEADFITGSTLSINGGQHMY